MSKKIVLNIDKFRQIGGNIFCKFTKYIYGEGKKDIKEIFNKNDIFSKPFFEDK